MGMGIGQECGFKVNVEPRSHLMTEQHQRSSCSLLPLLLMIITDGFEEKSWMIVPLVNVLKVARLSKDRHN